MVSKYPLMAVLVSLMLIGFVNAYVIGTASIPAPAVIPNGGGTLATINLTVTTGSGNVSVVGPAIVGESTLQSAQTAAQYASSYLHLNLTNYNFTYTIVSEDSNVSGPSGGAAMTLLAISALSHKQLRSDFTITGTILSDGTIGAISGVYNKVAAAYQDGLGLVLLPTATYSGESKLYLLVQAEFGIPLVQVSNITQASTFAFNASASGLPYEAAYDLGTNYSIDKLPQATLPCSNQCNESAFTALANYTISTTEDIIRSISDSRFHNISQQLDEALAQSAQIAGRGYLYAGANFAFQDYLNAVYFREHDTDKSSTLSNLENAQTFCSSLVPPRMTADDYEYVISAELRQEWGNLTMSQELPGYNDTATETDTVLNNVYLYAETRAWCNAAAFTYGYFANSTSNSIGFLPALSGIAKERLDTAAKYGYTDMYYNAAQQAFKNKNYPAAILGADYAFTISNASAYGIQATTQQLLTAAQSVAQQNSTYGAWATEFAKEAQFYAYQVGVTNNTSLAHSYALQAYTAAFLAQQIGTDVKLIYGARVSLPNTTANTTLQTAILINAVDQLTNTVNQLAVIERFTAVLLFVVFVMLFTVLAFVAILIKRSTAKINSNKRPRQRQRRRRGPRQKRRR